MTAVTNATQITDLLFSGVLARYPKLKFISVESGVGWIPFMLEAMLSRLHGHSSASGANRVADEADCLMGFEKKLEQRGLRTRQQMDELRARFTAELQDAHKRVRQEPMPDANSIWRHTFSDVDLVRGEDERCHCADPRS